MLRNVAQKSEDQLLETPILHQTSWWSDVKSKVGLRAKAISFKVNHAKIHQEEKPGGLQEADMLVLLEPLSPNHTIAYVPYGPETEPDAHLQSEFLENLSESLRSILPNGCIAIRYDLLWKSFWADDRSFYDPEGNWTGPPESRIQELRFNMNTHNWNFRKAYSNILPTNTIFVDLQKNPDQLLQAMKPKTRYNIGLAERKGVEVKVMGMDQIDVWHKLYAETIRRNGICPDDPDYFRAVFSARAEHSTSPAKVFLLGAFHQDNPLAAMFLVISQKRATYLYGASASAGRNLMAPYALQWEAMKMARAMGCTDYDMFGVAPNADPSHPMYGLYKFKKGFGGQIFHSLGCWDYPLDTATYASFRTWEMNRQGYHLKN